MTISYKQVLGTLAIAVVAGIGGAFMVPSAAHADGYGYGGYGYGGGYYGGYSGYGGGYSGYGGSYGYSCGSCFNGSPYGSYIGNRYGYSPVYQPVYYQPVGYGGYGYGNYGGYSGYGSYGGNGGNGGYGSHSPTPVLNQVGRNRSWQ